MLSHANQFKYGNEIYEKELKSSNINKKFLSVFLLGMNGSKEHIKLLEKEYIESKDSEINKDIKKAIDKIKGRN